MTSLSRLSNVELQALIRKDPTARVAAWAEIKFRNQARQAFGRENGQHGKYHPGTVYDHSRDYAKQWSPPDLTPPGPMGDGPLKG